MRGKLRSALRKRTACVQRKKGLEQGLCPRTRALWKKEQAWREVLGQEDLTGPEMLSTELELAWSSAEVGRGLDSAHLCIRHLLRDVIQRMPDKAT